MDFTIPSEITAYLASLDDFIEREITPLQEADDNMRFFDHRREWARTDFENGGVPRADWEELLAEAKRRADAAGFFRFSIPAELGGDDGSNLAMAIIREHLARKGLGLHNDLQNEHSIVGNLVFVELLHRFGTAEQKERFVEPSIRGEAGLAFSLTEPDHGSDATWMSTRAIRDGSDWVITGQKRFTTIPPGTTDIVVFARTSGEKGSAKGITAFIVPLGTPGLDVPFYWWTFNMPSDHAEVTIDEVRVPADAILGREGEGLDVAQTFVHENRIRQAASSLGAGQYCIDRSVEYARERVTFGRPLASRQAIQWPLVELATDAELIRSLVHRTAHQMDEVKREGRPLVSVGHLVSMCNYRANRLAVEAADRAIQVHGGIGYTRSEPFEHIYRHHRRYRITEGSEEIQIRRVGGHLFGYLESAPQR